MTTRRRAQTGMTLIEVVIALAVLGVMMSLAWQTTSMTGRVKGTFETLQERAAEIRVATARMVHDVESAYLSNNEDSSWTDRRTRFIGKDVELEMSTLGHTPLWANATESEQTLVRYYVDADREDPSLRDLFRYETRRLANEAGVKPPGQLDILVRGVDSVRFQYWDWQDKEWQESWSSTSTDAEPGRMPSRVAITVKVKPSGATDDSDIIEYRTQARVMLQERLNFFITE